MIPFSRYRVYQQLTRFTQSHLGWPQMTPDLHQRDWVSFLIWKMYTPNIKCLPLYLEISCVQPFQVFTFGDLKWPLTPTKIKVFFLSGGQIFIQNVESIQHSELEICYRIYKPSVTNTRIYTYTCTCHRDGKASFRLRCGIKTREDSSGESHSINCTSWKGALDRRSGRTKIN